MDNWKRRVAIAVFADCSTLVGTITRLADEFSEGCEMVAVCDAAGIDRLRSNATDQIVPSTHPFVLELMTIDGGRPGPVDIESSQTPAAPTTSLGSRVARMSEWLSEPMSNKLVDQVSRGASILFVAVENAPAEPQTFRILLRSCIGAVQLHDLPGG